MKRTNLAAIAGAMSGLVVACTAVLGGSGQDTGPGGGQAAAGGASNLGAGGSGNGVGVGNGTSTAGYGPDGNGGGAPVGFSGPVSSTAALRKIKMC